MMILIDKVFGPDGSQQGRMEFDTEQTLSHPDKPGVTISGVDYIAWLNADSARRTQAGWHEYSHLPGEVKPFNRWQRLLAHTASEQGHPDLKALALKDGDKTSEDILAETLIGGIDSGSDSVAVIHAGASGERGESDISVGGETLSGDSFWRE